MQILTTASPALSPAARAFDASSSYLVEAVTDRDGVTVVTPGTRWTDAGEAERAARGAYIALVAHLRRDLGADPDPAEVAALRTDPKALTVSWVAGEPCDETLVWRKSWRVVEDTTPRTVRPAVAMSCVAILAAVTEALALAGSVDVRAGGATLRGSWTAEEWTRLHDVLRACCVMIDADASTVVVDPDGARAGVAVYRLSRSSDAEWPSSIHGTDGGVVLVYADGSALEVR